MQEIIRDMLKEINPYIEVTDETNLFDAGLMDSMSILLLISLIEEHYQIEIEMDQINIENFETIQTIEKFIHSIINNV